MQFLDIPADRTQTAGQDIGQVLVGEVAPRLAGLGHQAFQPVPPEPGHTVALQNLFILRSGQGELHFNVFLGESGVPEGTLFFTPQKASLPEKDPSGSTHLPHPVYSIFLATARFIR